MTQKTKAELTAEREAYHAQRRAEEALTYPSRLMKALEEATSVNNRFNLTVRDGQFVVRDPNSRSVYTLGTQYTEDFHYKLDDLSSDLDDLKREREEANRKAAARSAALAKLSAAERELLGL